MTALIKVIELVAATWYISYVVTNKAGPFRIFTRAREWREGKWHGRTSTPKSISIVENKARTEYEITHDGLLDCIICMSPYVALLLWLINSDYLTVPFAIAGLALWAHSYTGWIHFGGK